MKTFGCAAVLLAAMTFSAGAQELTEEQQTEATEFAVNNSIFVLNHEIGHLLIGEMGIPVLGKEEDAADNVASITLLQQETDEANAVLIDSADGWWLSENSKAGQDYESADFYGVHSLDIQRSYQIVCLMVGADPAAFGEIATEFELDEERQEGCQADYDQATNSWGTLLEPYLRNGGPGESIMVEYDPADEDYADLEQLLKDMQFLETAAKTIEGTYALPRPITFRGSQCGEENAWYDPEAATVTFCYEMTAFFFDLIAQHMLSEGKS